MLIWLFLGRGKRNLILRVEDVRLAVFILLTNFAVVLHFFSLEHYVTYIHQGLLSCVLLERATTELFFRLLPLLHRDR